MASPPITPTNLLYPDLMPAFPYIASASVAAEARARDVAGTDEGGGSDGGKKNRLAGKRVGASWPKFAQNTNFASNNFLQNNEKMRREAIKSQVTQLTATIPGMASYSHTRKAVMLCTLEYIQQLQTREKRLRVQLISRYLRERGLISSLLRRGTGLEEIAGLCAEATTGQLDEVVAEIESSIA